MPTSHDYEKLVLGMILRYPSTEKIPERITAELTEDKFTDKANRTIYRAINHLVLDGQIPNTVNVSTQLNSALDRCGGIEYLSSLVTFTEEYQIYEANGYENWIKMVDTAGRYRQFLEIAGQYDKNDTDRLLNEHPNIDEFLANFVTSLNSSIQGTKSSYIDISEFANEVERKAKEASEGLIVDLIPCGMPCLANALIPRPGTFGGIIGTSGTGKTSLALQIMLGVAQDLYHNNKLGKVSINSLETSAEDVFSKLACFVSKTNGEELARGNITGSRLDKFLNAVHYVKKLPIAIDDNPSITSDEVYFQASIMNMQYKRILGIADYTELFTDKAQSEEIRVSGIIKKIKSISRKLGSCEILLSQFNNESTKNDYKMGSLEGSRYSGAYKQALDWGIVIYNPKQMIKQGYRVVVPDDKNEDYAYLNKQKDRKYGVQTATVEWIAELSMFRDLSKSVEAHYPMILPSYEF